jgi:putative transposase
VERVITEHGVSERFACRVLGQHRSTQRKIPKPRDDEAALTADIIALAIQYGRLAIAASQRCCARPAGQ